MVRAWKAGPNFERRPQDDRMRCLFTMGWNKKLQQGLAAHLKRNTPGYSGDSAANKNQKLLLGAPIRDKLRKLGMGHIEIRTNRREGL